MKFYRIRHADQRGFPYAYGYGPLSHPIPFVWGENLKSFKDLWKLNPMQPGLEIAESGSKWADFMLCGSGLPSLLYTERVLISLKALRCETLSETEFPVGKILSKKLRDVPPPRYFACQWKPGIELDWEAWGIKKDERGVPILPAIIPPPVAKLSTWNGDNVFSWSNHDETHLTMLCTENVVELAKKEKWINVRFNPIPTS